MENPLKIGENIIQELRKAVAGSKPTLETERGRLFIVEGLPIGAIKLKVSNKDYMNFISGLAPEEKPEHKNLIPLVNGFCEYIIFGDFIFDGKSVFIAGRKITFI